MKIVFTTAVACRTRGEVAELDDQSAEIVIAQGFAHEYTENGAHAEPSSTDADRRGITGTS